MRKFIKENPFVVGVIIAVIATAISPLFSLAWVLICTGLWLISYMVTL